MLDIKFIRENTELVREGLKKRGVDVDVDRLLELDKVRRSSIKSMEDTAAEQNRLSGGMAKEQDLSRRAGMLAEAQELTARKDEATHILKDIGPEYENLLRQIPNLPQDDVPVGKDEKDNEILHEWPASAKATAGKRKKPKFNFQPKDYLEIAENLDIIDIKRAAKVSGSRFGYLKGEAARLEFALVQFALGELTKEGFIPVVPPVLIKEEMMRDMGYIENSKVKSQNSKINEEEIYFMRDDDLVLVGTSEQSVGPMHAGEIFEEKDLPRRYVAFSTCFRREAGSYGRDTRGILRVHQFDKVEMFSFCHPEKSHEEHRFLLKMAEKLMQKLEIPYRVVQLCSGDLARPSAATYDIESWMPGQGEYRETHSISNTTDFQARRLNIRFKNRQPATKNQKLEFVHMLNGTAFAIGRTLIALIENYQQKNGSVKVPKAVEKYTGFSKIPHKI